jgi:lipopolysaccharide transport system permease protein
MGLSWGLASLGVYLRDVSQFIGLATTVLMFLSPIFYPVTALPEEYRHLLLFNPLTPAIEQARDVLVWGKVPDVTMLSVTLLGAALIAWLGFAWFQKTRKGFADVL